MSGNGFGLYGTSGSMVFSRLLPLNRSGETMNQKIIHRQPKSLWKGIYIYIRSLDCLLLCSVVRLFGCSGFCYLPIHFGQLFRCAHKRIVNFMKVYIQRNNMQVELIRFRKKCRLYSRLRLRIERLYVYSIFARWQHASPHCSKVNILHK